jgi:hypothetical protein
MKSDSTPTTKCRVQKIKKLVKPGGTAENVAHHCTLEDVTTNITLKNVCSKFQVFFTINIEIINYFVPVGGK